MKRSRVFGSTSVVAMAAFFAGSGTAYAQIACADLTGLSIPGMTVTAATPITAGTVFPSAGQYLPSVTATVPFCRVQATLNPVDGSKILMEVWLPPASSWDGRFQGTGGGGFWGAINEPELMAGVARGDATANDDQGHEGGVADASFIVGHPQEFIDFGYRATHLTAIYGKEIVSAYYGKAASHNYFNGCSSGGRQALKEAQAFPNDYDGILAGDPANDWVNLNFDQIYETQVNTADAADTIPPADYALINNAVLEQCGREDGVADPGFVANPPACRFNPEVLQCVAGSNAPCLTNAQIATVRKIYAGPIDQRTKQRLFPGFEPGSETGWSAITEGGGFSIADSYFQYFVFGDPSWNYLTLNYGSDVTAAEAQDHGVVGAVNSNLTPFEDHGGKLIQYHGWADTTISPGSSTNYYERVAAGRQGNARAQRIDAIAEFLTPHYDMIQSFYRLFMVPGMAHCGGGPGLDAFGQSSSAPGISTDPKDDIFSALEQWVETGKAPDRIVAVRYNNDTPGDGVQYSRPLCPYPQVAQYKGRGDPTDASSFACIEPPR